MSKAQTSAQDLYCFCTFDMNLLRHSGNSGDLDEFQQMPRSRLCDLNSISPQQLKILAELEGENVEDLLK